MDPIKVDSETADKLAYQTKRTERERRRFYAREPQSLGKVLATVMIKNRYASNSSNAALAEVWEKIVGQAHAARTLPVAVRRGKLEVTVAHSAISQELSFDSRRIIAALQQQLPEAKITDVRYRVGTIG
jgi:predicted nucleic acid-binding Zn ribbon protein